MKNLEFVPLQKPAIAEVLARLRASNEMAGRDFVNHNILRAELLTNRGEGLEKYENVTALRFIDLGGTNMLVRIPEVPHPSADDEGDFQGASEIEIVFRGASEYETLASALEFFAHAVRAQGVRQ